MRASERPEKLRATAFDGLAAALSPALIIGMIGSLVFFLIIAFYRGEYDIRLMYLMGLYTVAIVLVARIAIESDRLRAAMFAIPLAIAAMLAIMRFVTISGPLAPFSLVINVGLLGLIWYLADRITFDCTLLEEDRESLQGGLLQTIGSQVAPASNNAEQPGGKAQAPTEMGPTGAARSGKQPIGAAPLKKAKHNPGVWVLYFALIAFPLFGVGQMVIPDERQRSIAFWCLIAYLGCALSLLMTTSLLGMRRYLRQRGAMMPPEITGKWLIAGGGITLAILTLCMLMPLPGKQLSVAGLKIELTSPNNLSTSKFGWGSEGSQNQAQSDQPSNTDQHQGQQGQGQQGQGQQGQGQQGQGQQGQGQQGQGQQGQGQQGQGQQGQGQQGQGQQGQGQQGQGQQGQGQQGQGQQGQGQQGQGQQGQQGQGQQGQGQQGQEQQGQGQQGQGQQGQGQQGRGEKSSPNAPDMEGQRSVNQSQDAQQSGSNGPNDNQPNRNPARPNAAQENGPVRNPQNNNQQNNNQQNNNQQNNNQQNNNQQNNNPQNDNGQANADPAQQPRQPNAQPAQPPQAAPEAAPPEAQPETLRAGNSLSQTSRSLASSLLDTLRTLGSLFKWLLIAVLAGIVLFFVATHFEEVKRLIQDLVRFISALMGRSPAPLPASEPVAEPTVPQRTHRPFRSFPNPFTSGLKGWQTAQVVVHTFAALEAWAAQRGRVRAVDQTAEEFARTLVAHEPELDRHPLQAATMLDRVMFAGWQPTPQEVAALGQLWERMES